jgi:prepilin-type N-terminal cleavage/methylation domain-containing protein
MASGRLLNRQRGFSLIELMIVMAIGLILMAMAVPIMGDRDNVGGEVRRLIADTVRARSWAQTTWRETTVDFDLQNNRWRLVDEEGDILPGTEADELGWRYLANGIRFEAIDGEEIEFEFEADGRSEVASSLLIVGGSSTWILQCSPLSGSISAEPWEQ